MKSKVNCDEKTGLRLQAIRKALGMSQQALADMMGCSKRTILEYEQGKRGFAGYIALALWGETGVNLDWLFTGKGKCYDPYCPVPDEVMRKNPHAFAPENAGMILNAYIAKNAPEKADVAAKEILVPFIISLYQELRYDHVKNHLKQKFASVPDDL